jgi:hypothetical protein
MRKLLITTLITILSITTHATSKQYNFAHEFLPNTTRINKEVKHSLIKYNFKNIQSTILQRKATHWFPIIEPILKQYNIPNDFKYMPLVESGLNPGTSRTGAKGMWQFMPQTARDCKLIVNKHRDDRLNEKLSTIAACVYLRDLYTEFHNWTLVAAAYNNGSNKIHRAMKHQFQSNFYRLKLNHETTQYIYALIAMKEIIEKPMLYGYIINDPYIFNALYTFQNTSLYQFKITD